MKLKVLTALVFCFLFFLAACGPSNSNASNNSEWTFKIVGGTTNIDESFFNTSLVKKTQAIRYQALSKTFLASTNIELSPQLTAATGVNFFASLHHPSKSIAEPTNLVFKGPHDTYEDPSEYPENTIWTVYFPLFSQGKGKYQAEITIEGEKLTASTELDDSKLLPSPVITNIGRTGSAMAAKWQPIAKAKSYLISVYDFNIKDVVAVFVTKKSEIVALDLPLQTSHKADITVFALSWDATQLSDKPYPEPLPKTFDIAISSFPLREAIPVLGYPQEPFILSTHQGDTTSKTLDITNAALNEGVIIYSASLEKNPLVEILKGHEGSITLGDRGQIEMQLKCGEQDVQTQVTLALLTNISQSPISIPIFLECLNDLSVQALNVLPLQGSPKSLGFMDNSSEIFAVTETSIYGTEFIKKINIYKQNLTDNVLKTTTLYDLDFIAADFNSQTKVLSLIAQDIRVTEDKCPFPQALRCQRLVLLDKASDSIISSKLIPMLAYISFSPDGSKYAGTNPYSKNYIELRDSSTGEIYKELENPVNTFNKTVYWSHDGSKIALLVNNIIYIWISESGKQELQLDIKAATEQNCNAYELYWGSEDSSLHFGHCFLDFSTQTIYYKANRETASGYISNNYKYLLQLGFQDLSISSAFTRRQLSQIHHDLNSGHDEFIQGEWDPANKIFALFTASFLEPLKSQIHFWQLEELE